MKRLILLLSCLGIFSLTSLHAQEDWSWWNDLHGWKEGMPGWRSFLIISPGYLGPNALPVPEVKKGILSLEKEFEFGSDFHFRSGDNTQNLFGKLYYPFSSKIAIEVYGVLLERYAMSESIRDERKARDRDGEGLTRGDLYFSTLIQLFKDRKFPNTLLRMAAKTASGGNFDAARYADSPGYFIDFSFSKSISNSKSLHQWTPFASFGFYSWQTNDVENLQNDAFMFASGVDVELPKWTITNSVSGYLGYKNERDQPVVYTFDVRKKLRKNELRFQFIEGIHNWEYTTVKFSYIWKLE